MLRAFRPEAARVQRHDGHLLPPYSSDFGSDRFLGE
jgi:hypothetical protein